MTDLRYKPFEPSERNKLIYKLWSSGKSYEEIGETYELTRERVRQIISKFVRYQRRYNPWFKQFSKRTATLLLKQGIFSEEDLHRVFDENNKLPHAGKAVVDEINGIIAEPLVKRKIERPRVPSRYERYVGKRFGKLTVIGVDYESTRETGARRLICKCDCGNVKNIRAGNVIQGLQTSCGCLCDEYRKSLGQRMKNNKWIPCTQMMPESHGMYLVSTKDGDVYTCEWDASGFNCTSEVLAWMLLPKAYMLGEIHRGA